MKIKCVWDHNGNDSLIYSGNLIGAFTRGVSKKDALKKIIIATKNPAVTLRKFIGKYRVILLTDLYIYTISM